MPVILFVDIHAHTKQSEQVQDTNLATIWCMSRKSFKILWTDPI